MTEQTTSILAKDVRKSYGALQVLKGVDLAVERGTILAVLGPNGAGKTTTVRILATLLKLDSGNATIEGHEVTTQAHEVRGVIGLTGQNAAIDEFLTGRENLRMMGRLYHLSREDAEHRTEQLLKQFDLKDAADRVAKTYSGGMKRRLDLAASLIAMPPVLFLDEPTTGLDPRSRLALWDIIKNLANQGTTILLTTQYMEEADHLADRIVVIDGGKVIAEGTPDELKDRVGKERIELVFKTDSELAKASTLITGKTVQTDDKRRTISVANDGGVRALTALLEKIAKAGIEVESLSLHKPTLDDVFLQLTGHAVETDSPETEGKKTNKRGGKK